MQTIIVTGAAGFIGFHLSRRLLALGYKVHGIDALNAYYDPALKEARLAILAEMEGFTFTRGLIEKPGLVAADFATHRPDTVFHLAAQAGVRHSLKAPRDYVSSNLEGSLEILEAARAFPPRHLLMASTSSVYGSNPGMPWSESQPCDHQMSFYAATKRANESMAHAYAHLHGLPISMLRFFTVYGPWGRPDMALYDFVSRIRAGRPIDLYNHGEMWRDFTYVDDLVEAMVRLGNATPHARVPQPAFDSLSPVAPFRVINIGHGRPSRLTDFLREIERALGLTAVTNLLPMQPGDVARTWADTSLLGTLVGTLPGTSLAEGVARFVDWHRSYHP